MNSDSEARNRELPNSVSLDDHRTGPTFLLALLGVDALHRLEEALFSCELTSREFEALATVCDAGHIGQRELGIQMKTAPSVLVAVLNTLEKAGLLIRTRDESDRRKHTITATVDGQNRRALADRALLQASTQHLAMLSASETDELTHLLTGIRDGLTDGLVADSSAESLEAAAIRASLMASASLTRGRNVTEDGNIVPASYR